MEFLEEELKQDHIFLAGVDEVGRGPLAGPVVSCACYYEGTRADLSNSFNFFKDLGVTDSKKITPRKRKNILKELNVKVEDISFGKVSVFSVGGLNFSFSLSEMSPQKIDQMNILQASLLSMSNALDCLNLIGSEALIWIDGNKIPKELRGHSRKEALVKGDSRSLLIGLASILAKEKRDLLMEKLGQKYPGYGFEKHAGYPTKFHKDAVKELGVTSIHRKSFKGVKEFVKEATSTGN